ncbi:uncharacterized protein EV420DRAFT_1633652 [Desarmillaria tabescens]|uniref:Uncharacterized protein n=1 Tax=Armillaria tabescens TaxID=1929756 RepID=A0AA39U280_ARMTA|nr:uncharacterized protein EV420DRAFT_1633652 [Desarmillaria tabescens]KAK0469229.1 hypothetical protein EV420DRAFT_1633652 [Desarmillaria tabescens]
MEAPRRPRGWDSASTLSLRPSSIYPAMHLSCAPVDFTTASSTCALSFLSLAVVLVILACVWACRHQQQGDKKGVWKWGVLTLETLQSTPTKEKESMSVSQLEGQHRRVVYYESQAPVSMAKIIMSRHTFRRPTPRSIPPPPRPSQQPPISTPRPQSGPGRRTRSLSPPRLRQQLPVTPSMV